jgi:uncharacterized surface anchored protein
MSWKQAVLRLGAIVVLVVGLSIVLGYTALADEQATPVTVTTNDGPPLTGSTDGTGDEQQAASGANDETNGGTTGDSGESSATDPTSAASPEPEPPGANDSTPGDVPVVEQEADASPAPDRQITAAATTGTVVAVAEDENGDAISHACFIIYYDNGASLGPYITNKCDDVDGVSDGTATLTDVPAGNLVLVLSQTGPSGQFVNGVQVRFTLTAGETKTVTVTTERGGRTVQINKVDENSDALGGACFNIFTDAGGGQVGDFVTSNCDGPPGGPYDGVTLIPGLLPGDYVAYESVAPQGYLRGPNTPFSIPAEGDVPAVTVQNLPLLAAGNLIVHKVDEHGDPLAGACFIVYRDAGSGALGDYVTQVCDPQDGQNDGTLIVTGLSAGDYLLREFHAPNGYINGGTTSFTMEAGKPTELTVPNTPGGATLTIRKVDATTHELLTGACFVVYRDNGNGQITPDSTVEGRCDASDGSDNGITPFTGLATGDYILFERVAPSGYTASHTILFSVDADQHGVELTVENTKGETPQYGTLIIKKVDEAGNPLPGACFALFDPRSDLSEPVTEKCDGSVNDQDGVNDGTVTYMNNGRGTFLVRETRAPDGYAAAADQTITIDSGQTVTVTFVDTLIQEGGAATPPEDQATPETGAVTTLPATGAGPLAAPLAGGEAFLLGLLGLAALGAAFTWRRRMA